MDLSRDARILYVSSVDVSLGNGPGVNESGFIAALDSAMGGRTHFLVPRPNQEVQGLPVDRCTFVRSHRGHSPVRYAAHMLDQYRQLARLVTSNFDLICVRLDVLPLGMYSLLRRGSVPYVIKTLGQGPLNALQVRGRPIGPMLSGPNRRMFRSLVRGAVVADACSPSMVQLLNDRLGIPPGQIVWIDNAVDVHRFFPRPTAEAKRELGLSRFGKIVGYVGSRPWERGGLALINAAPSLLEVFHDLGVLIVGNGPKLRDLRKRAADLGIADRCILTGPVAPDQVPTYVNALDVGVSINDRSDRYHAAELKVRQYVACGKPVVVSPGGNGFVVEADLGAIVDERLARDLVAALTTLLRRSAEQTAMFSERARAYAVHELSYERSVERRLAVWGERYPGQGR